MCYSVIVCLCLTHLPFQIRNFFFLVFFSKFIVMRQKYSIVTTEDWLCKHPMLCTAMKQTVWCPVWAQIKWLSLYIQGSIKSYKILSTFDFVGLQLVKVWACPTSTDISTYKLKNRYKCRYLIEFVDIFIFSSLRHKREHKRARHSVNSLQTVSSTVSLSCSCVAEWVQNALKVSKMWWFAWFILLKQLKPH